MELSWLLYVCVYMAIYAAHAHRLTLLCTKVPGQSEAHKTSEGAAEPHAGCTTHSHRCSAWYWCCCLHQPLHHSGCSHNRKAKEGLRMEQQPMMGRRRREAARVVSLWGWLVQGQAHMGTLNDWITHDDLSALCALTTDTAIVCGHKEHSTPNTRTQRGSHTM